MATAWLTTGCLLALAPAASAETFFVETRDPAGATSSSILAAGVPYRMTIRGTYSIVSALRWGKPLACGTPDAAPVFPTAGVSNGPAGYDAETLWAQTRDEDFCAPLPRRHTAVEVDTGSGLQDRDPVEGPTATPRADHTYTYDLTGEGKAVRVRLFDAPARDNYGRLEVTVEPAGGTLGGAGDVPPAAAVVPPSDVRSNSASGTTAPKACNSRRTFRIRLRIPKGTTARRAVVRVNGKVVKVVRGDRLRAPVNLVGLPKGRITVRIAVKLSSGRTLNGTRVYRTCVPKSTQRTIPVL